MIPINTLIIETDKEYVFKTVEQAIVEIPDWDCDYVNVVLWDENTCSQDGCRFTINDCGELLLKAVNVDEVKTIDLEEYEGEDVLIVQI